MPRVKFLKDFDYKPIPQQTFSYKAGSVYLVKQECADRAIKAGAGELTTLKPPPSSVADTIRRQRRKPVNDRPENPTQEQFFRIEI